MRSCDGTIGRVLLFAGGVLLLLLSDPLLRAAVRPPAPLGPDAPAERFSEARARAFHERVFAGERPHPLGSDEAERVRERLLGELRGLGCSPVVEEHVVVHGGRTARVRNIVVPPPTAATQGAVLLCAHYDSVAAGPGASDDGAGVAVLLEVARSLAHAPAPGARPVLFLFDDGEEMGLFGARAFVEQSAWRERVAVVVNLEARGTSGASRMFETSAGNAELVRLCGAALPDPSATSLSYEVYKRMPNDTDLTVFKEAGLPGLNFAFVGGGRRYHTPLDDLAHLDRRTLQHHGDNALSIVRALAAHAGPFTAADDAVYADLLGRVLLRWPGVFAPWIAALLLVAVALAAARGLRSGTVRAADLVRGAVAGLGTPLAALGLAWILVLIVTRSDGGVYPWPPGSGAGRAALVLAAGAGAALAGALGSGARSHPRDTAGFARGFATGLVLVQVLAGLAAALVVPGASYLFALPGIAAAAALAVAPRLALGLSTACAALFFVPLVAALEEVCELGTRNVPAALLFAALWGWLAAPLAGVIAVGTRRAAAFLALGQACVAVLLVFVALRAPTHTPDDPEPIALAHVEEEGDAPARQSARPFGARVVRDWLDRRAFAADPARDFPWWSRSPRARHRPVARLGLPAPEFEVVARRASEAGREVDLRIASVRGARHLVLELPRGVELRGLQVGATPSMACRASGEFAAVGFGTSPLLLTLRIRTADEVEAGLLDVASAGGPLAELVRELPPASAPIGEGVVSVAARRVRF